MLLLASGAHLYLLPGRTTSLPEAIGGSVSRAGLAAALPSRPVAAPPSVTIVTELVPVGTSGVVEAPRSSPMQSVSLTPDQLTPDQPVAASDWTPEVRAIELKHEPEPEPHEPPPPAVERAMNPEPLPAPALPPPPPPATSAAASPPRAPITVPVRPAVNQQQLVRQLLEDYASAYGRLDADAAKALWPTVDEKALRRAFAQLEAQQVEFQSCGITIAGSGAHARCRGAATFRPRVGSRTVRVSEGEWTFDLAQAATGWHIVDARVR